MDDQIDPAVGASILESEVHQLFEPMGGGQRLKHFAEPFRRYEDSKLAEGFFHRQSKMKSEFYGQRFVLADL